MKTYVMLTCEYIMRCNTIKSKTDGTNIEENSPIITILMATYNGGKFIADQLDSIINQTYSRWSLLIRDDISNDDTKLIINRYASLDKRIIVINDNFGNKGACQNFAALMNIPTDARYIMFCDQDDIWLPNKIHDSLNSMHSLESQYGHVEPLMVYGTFSMIDEFGNAIPRKAPDFSIRPSLPSIISQNYIYGCTMMINRSLLELSKDVPISAENHDYWIALVAASNNAKFAYIPKPILLYRQHSHNVSGSYKDSNFLRRIFRIIDKTEYLLFTRRTHMIRDLFSQFEHRMHVNHSIFISGYLSNLSKGGLKAVKYCVDNRVKRLNWRQTFLFYINSYNFGKN